MRSKLVTTVACTCKVVGVTFVIR
eukprot:SAG11_NODE_14699_length_602_cov_3.095427_1_plen_23_part_10